jgi:hypothetical protein
MLERWPVTSEVASSSLVGPAIHTPDDAFGPFPFLERGRGGVRLKIKVLKSIIEIKIIPLKKRRRFPPHQFQWPDLK